MTRSTCIYKLCFLMFVSITSQGVSQEKAESKAQPDKLERRVIPAMVQIEDDANLPRVLLIGDSISIGYTVDVRQLLTGKANVHRPPTNCGPTTNGVAEIDNWLGDKKWDVIHFNFGLHDLKYMGPNGENLADPKVETSKPQVSIEDYEANLRKIVARLKETNATLIWGNTTPIPAGAAGRVVGDAAKYNAVAERIMDENKIQINDLYSYSKENLSDIQLPKNVHFSQEGSKFLAEKVTEKILAALPNQ